MKYQYKIIRQPMGEEDLNEVGQEGWQLVTAPRGADTTYYFCKPVDGLDQFWSRQFIRKPEDDDNSKNWWSRFWDRVCSRHIEVPPL